MNEQLALLPGYLAAHLALSLAALCVGVLVSVPLGVWITRNRRLEAPVLGAASVMQTIPGLALLAVMVPALAALGAPSIGALPALIGLSLYSVLPILRNTVTGLRGIDPAVLEAARGVGMTDRESLLQVELPLSAPVIIAGIRTAAVWTVGTATLSTPVGAESLGNYIFAGLQTRNLSAVLLGCVASALLALLIDGLVRGVSVGLSRPSRHALVGSLLGFVALGLFAASPLLVRGSAAGPRPVVFGAKTFTESYILAELLAEHTARQTGLPVQTLSSLGSTVVFDALAGGQIDAYVDYSGTLWTAVLKGGDPIPDRDSLLEQLRERLPREHGIQLVASLGFENTYALAMREADAERLSARSIGDLAPHAPGLRVGADYELFSRPEWASITGTYGLRFGEQRSMDPSLMYEAARAGQVDVISAFSTDGRISSYKLRVLLDDRGAIPPYDAVVLASARSRPEVIVALEALAGRIDAEAMRAMNRAVDEDGQTPAAAARGFLDRASQAPSR